LGLIAETPSNERRTGIGLATLLFCLAGLNQLRRASPWGRCLVWCLPVIFVLTLNVYNGMIWKLLVFSWVPGASAIRGLTRIFFLVLLVLPIGLALALENKRPLAQALIVLICLAESFPPIVSSVGALYAPPSFGERSKVLGLSAAIAAEAVKYEGPFVLLENGDSANATVGADAMMASLLADRPTINGHSAFKPPNYISLNDIKPVPREEIASPYLAEVGGEFLVIFRPADGPMTSWVALSSEGGASPLGGK
jgi:hypothetical protein